MPSAISPEYLMASSPTRKRRREDNGEMQMPFSSTFETSQNRYNNERSIKPSIRGPASPFGVPRKVLALPVSKKFRIVGDHDDDEPPHNHYLHRNDFPPSALAQESHFSHAHPEQTSAASTTRTNSSALLSPCHICHRKPTKKSDLDSFGDCTGCGERTCFVCLRACQGWIPAPDVEDAPYHTPTETENLSASFTMHDVDDEESVHDERTATTQKPQQREKKGEGGGDDGNGDAVSSSWNGRGHRSVICSRCCVEQGSEGDVVCLGCLAGIEGA